MSSNTEVMAVLHDLARIPDRVSEYSNQRRKSKNIPGPKSHPWSGNLRNLEESGGIHNFLPALHRHYGSVAKFWLGPLDLCISLSDPDYISELSHLNQTPEALQKPMKWMGDVFWVGRSSDQAERVKHIRTKLTPLLGDLLAHLCEN